MKNIIIPIAFVSMLISCAVYERSHIEMRQRSKALAAHAKPSNPAPPIEESVSLYDDILNTIQSKYFESISYDSTQDTSVESLLSKLDDYSYHLDDEELSNSNKSLQIEDLTDLGFGVARHNDSFVISSIRPFSFAYEKGLLPGDRLVGINSESLVGTDLERIYEHLNSALNTSSTINVFRPAEGMFYQLRTNSKSAEKLKTVYAKMLTGSVGYLRLTTFGKDSYDEVTKALDDLSAAGMQSLIFDLRGNTGGLVHTAVKIANIFFDEESPVLSLRSSVHHEDNKVIHTKLNGAYHTLPIILMVNRYSASASEMIAAIFQDKERALIVGMPTLGKGVMQTVFSLLPGHGEIKLTTHRIYTPTGRCIHVAPAELYRIDSLIPYDRFIDNLDHSFDRMLVRDTKNVFLTTKNRRIYDSIGVIPDYIVPSFSTAATRKLIGDDSLFNLILVSMREEYQRTFIKLQTPTKFYKDFPTTAAGKHVMKLIRSYQLELDAGDGEVQYQEAMKAFTKYISTNVNSYWAYTREALLDDRQVKFALSLLQKKPTQSTKKTKRS